MENTQRWIIKRSCRFAFFYILHYPLLYTKGAVFPQLLIVSFIVPAVILRLFFSLLQTTLHFSIPDNSQRQVSGQECLNSGIWLPS